MGSENGIDVEGKEERHCDVGAREIGLGRTSIGESEDEEEKDEMNGRMGEVRRRDVREEESEIVHASLGEIEIEVRLLNGMVATLRLRTKVAILPRFPFG
jgi:hypothetical protein